MFFRHALLAGCTFSYRTLSMTSCTPPAAWFGRSAAWFGRSTGGPTQHELERDFHGVLHGTKDGTVSAHHESPKLTGGSHEVIDDLR